MQNSEPVPLRIDGQESLTTEESSRLNQLEIVIEKGARAAGEALNEINESRLYRAEYRTLEEYCRSRWNRSRSYAYRLIDFAKAVKECSQNGDTAILKNEGRFRVSKKERPVSAKHQNSRRNRNSRPESLTTSMKS
jgi:hypothetical protein